MAIEDIYLAIYDQSICVIYLYRVIIQFWWQVGIFLSDGFIGF